MGNGHLQVFTNFSGIRFKLIATFLPEGCDLFQVSVQNLLKIH